MLLLSNKQVRCEALRPFIQANQFKVYTSHTLIHALAKWFLSLLDMNIGFNPFVTVRTLVLQWTDCSDDDLVHLIKRCSGLEHLILSFYTHNLLSVNRPRPTLDELHDYFNLQAFVKISHLARLTFECKSSGWWYKYKLGDRKGGVWELLGEVRDWIDMQYKARGATVEVEVNHIIVPTRLV
jgi:hypothetical protein